jgi:hypothetical protein
MSAGLAEVDHAQALYLDKREEIEWYGRPLDRLMVDARTPEQTRQLLRKARATG